ncbi:MAG: hypothetical protein ABI321_11365 [Polyangia bacterium]
MSKVDTQLKDDFKRARTAVERYGVRVYIGDVEDPNTGIFDGLEIGIDYANDLEMSLFVPVHRFGHTSSDWKSLSTYYATGKLPDWSDCRITGLPVLQPMPIPRFIPERFATRYAF